MRIPQNISVLQSFFDNVAVDAQFLTLVESKHEGKTVELERVAE